MQSIIVYRSPLEAMFWEGGGMYVFIAVVSAIFPFLVSYFVSERVQLMMRPVLRQHNPTIDLTIAVIVAIAYLVALFKYLA